MGKVKTQNYSEDLKERIVQSKLVDGKSYSEVADTFRVSRNTVIKMVRTFQKRGSVASMMHTTGRKRKTTPRTDRHMVLEAKRNPFTTANRLVKVAEDVGVEICRRTSIKRLQEYGLFACRPRKVPFHKKRHLKARLAFAKEHVTAPNSFWDRVMWTDESKIELWGPAEVQYVFRPKSKEYDPKFTLKTIKHPISLIVWGCISSNGTGTLHLIEDKMDGPMYVDILKKNVPESKKILGLGGRGRKWIFQQGKNHSL